MTLDLAKPVQTREGYPVRIFCTDGGGDYPIIGAWLRNGYWNMSRWNLNGTSNEGRELNLEPVRQSFSGTVYVSVFRDGSTSLTTYPTENFGKPVAKLELPWCCKEGDGLK